MGSLNGATYKRKIYVNFKSIHIPQISKKYVLTLGLLIKIKPLSDQVENFIRVTVGPKYPKNAFKIAVSLTPKVRQNGPASLLPKSQPPKVGQTASPRGFEIQQF